MNLNHTSRWNLAVGALAALALGLGAMSCGGGGSASPPPPPSSSKPKIDSLSPASGVAGDQGLTLTVTGSGFVQGSEVLFDGHPIPTTFASSTKLTAKVPAADIQTAETVQVAVNNPPYDGTKLSNIVMFPINNPIPKITSLSPSSAVAGSQGFNLTVLGSIFIGGATVRWNGADLPTAQPSDFEIVGAVPAANIASPGSAMITVFNPPLGGGVSNALTFTFSPPLPLEIKTTRLPDSTGGKAYNILLASTGGVPPVAWSLVSGALPTSLVLDPASGRISGNIDSVGVDTTVNFTVRVTDSASPAPSTTNMPLSITVRAGALGRNDACTPGSTAGTTSISNGRLRASISPYGDIDVYNFQGTAGQQVTIEIFAQRLDLDGNPATVDSWLDSMVELLDSSCPAAQANGASALAFSDDIDPGVVQDSVIQNFTLPYTGLYFIRVRDFRGDGRPDLIYDLSLTGAD